MVLKIVVIFAFIVFLINVVNLIREYIKVKKVVDMSFREAMDLAELPIVTFQNGDQKLNFLLDTGSNLSVINSSILPLVKYTKIEKSSDIIGIEGNKKKTEFCKMDVTYKDHVFENEFCIQNLSSAFSVIKEESGVQLHGILGNLFFQKYKYVLDFASLVAYTKK